MTKRPGAMEPNTAIEAPAIAFIGFSEAGQAIGGGLVKAGARRVAAYDLRFAGKDGAALTATAAALGIAAAASAAEAAEGADIVVSAVTAGAAVKVAEAAAQYIQPGQVFLDLNSVSPEDKRAVAAAISGSGAGFVEAAVMSPVASFGHKVPMLLGGAEAERVAAMLRPLGMDLAVAGPEIGSASAVKMCRSIMVKGIEALTVECLITARAYGVEALVTETLVQAFPGLDWPKRSGYMLGRVLAHGARRAEEMRCAADTVRAAGIAPLMAAATAERQQWVADLGPDVAGTSNGDVGARIDALIAAAKAKAAD
jgi:3-hydroxyisobutyrate dehydrogenase-like beta-hydroxyacid dehydrogenase